VAVLPEGKDPDDLIKAEPETWQRLTDNAMPIVDYTINIVTSKMDMSTAMNKSLSTDKILPVIAAIGNTVRRAHYLQKLTRLVGISYNSMEDILNDYQAKLKGQKPKQRFASHSRRTAVSNPIEEYCLSLLLQNPELKSYDRELSPQYFDKSENREIFLSWQEAEAISEIRGNLDAPMQEYLDSLLEKTLPADRLEQRYADYVRRLHERYLKSLESKRAEAFASEAETGGTGADLVKLEREGIEPSIQLKEVFAQKKWKRAEPRR